VSAGGWNVGIGNGTGGTNVIETSMPFPPGAQVIRLGFVYDDLGIGADGVIAGPTGEPILASLPSSPGTLDIPTLSEAMLALLVVLMGCGAYAYLRRHGVPMGPMAVVMLAMVATMAWAAIVLDGQTGDWAGPGPSRTPPETRRTERTSPRSSSRSRCRRSSFASTRAPAAAPRRSTTGYLATPGVTLNVPVGTGVLANDARGVPPGLVSFFGGGSLGGAVTGNPAGSTATFGTGGSLTVQADGSFTFVPAAGFTGNFTFSYRLANLNGFSDAVVTIGAREPPALHEREHRHVHRRDRGHVHRCRERPAGADVHPHDRNPAVRPHLERHDGRDIRDRRGRHHGLLCAHVHRAERRHSQCDAGPSRSSSTRRRRSPAPMPRRSRSGRRAASW
jgi:hypothetical protein